MTRFQYHSLTHSQNLSAFRESTMQDGACLLIGAAAPNAKTLVTSNKWADLEKLGGDAAGFEAKIEEICRLFTEHYVHVQQLRNGQSGFKPTVEIIESLAVLFLGADGRSYVYQAGKCVVMVVKRSGTHFPVTTETALSAYELSGDDRLVIDLQNAGILGPVGNYISFQNLPDMLPAEMTGFNYPFAIAYPRAEVIADTVNEPIPVEPVTAHSPEPFVPAVHQRVLPEPMTESKAERPLFSSKSAVRPKHRIWAALFLALAASGAAIVGWEMAGRPTMPESVTETHSRQSDTLSAAGEAMRQADQSLIDGYNQKALVALSRAEILYTQYVAAHPHDDLPEVRLKINEIRQKKRLLSKADNF